MNNRKSSPLNNLTKQQRDKLVVDNRGLVWHLINSMPYNPRVEREDLYACGCLGLVEAALRFQPERGLKFSTYSRFWIHAMIYAAIIRQCGIPAGNHAVRRVFWKLAKVESQYEAANVVPTEEVLAAHFNVPEEIVRVIRRAREDSVRMDAIGTVIADDKAPVDERYERAECAAIVRKAVEKLVPREREVLRRQYFGEEDNVAIGAKLGVSRERVRQLGVRALRNLRAQMGEG